MTQGYEMVIRFAAPHFMEGVDAINYMHNRIRREGLESTHTETQPGIKDTKGETD